MSQTSTASPNVGFDSILNSNQQTMHNIESYRNKKITNTPRNLLFGGVVIGTSLLFIMFAAQIITGMFAIILTGVTGISAFYLTRLLKNMDPYIRQKFKNEALKKMMNEAKDNAIYQLDNQVIKNSERLKQAREARNKMGALVQQLKSSINPENKGKPIYERKLEMLKKVETAYEVMGANLEAGAEANKKFKVKVNEYRDMNRFADIAGEAMALLGASGHKELEEMLSLESFNEIDSNFNSAIISIENSARDMQLDQEM